MKIGRPLAQFPFREDKLHIALENIPDLDFIWNEGQIEYFRFLWKKQMPLVQIAEKLGKSEMSVMFMAFDQLYEKKIKPRKGWRIW